MTVTMELWQLIGGIILAVGAVVHAIDGEWVFSGLAVVAAVLLLSGVGVGL